ncbi:hypothetical protein BMS3Abin01_00279 [bacterium BMS3Abin01]|nr:hypothetical protein BMS3Abin01_00279 [bacterium BMS3Abin01]
MTMVTPIIVSASVFTFTSGVAADVSLSRTSFPTPKAVINSRATMPMLAKVSNLACP